MRKFFIAGLLFFLLTTGCNETPEEAIPTLENVSNAAIAGDPVFEAFVKADMAYEEILIEGKHSLKSVRAQQAIETFSRKVEDQTFTKKDAQEYTAVLGFKSTEQYQQITQARLTAYANLISSFPQISNYDADQWVALIETYQSRFLAENSLSTARLNNDRCQWVMSRCKSKAQADILVCLGNCIGVTGGVIGMCGQNLPSYTAALMAWCVCVLNCESIKFSAIDQCCEENVPCGADYGCDPCVWCGNGN